MGGSKTTQQGGGGYRSDSPRQGTEADGDHGADPGAPERATRGKDDADATGTSINQGHGHPRGERGSGG
jgi:hypothetical protein